MDDVSDDTVVDEVAYVDVVEEERVEVEVEIELEGQVDEIVMGVDIEVITETEIGIE